MESTQSTQKYSPLQVKVIKSSYSQIFPVYHPPSGSSFEDESENEMEEELIAGQHLNMDVRVIKPSHSQILPSPYKDESENEMEEESIINNLSHSRILPSPFSFSYEEEENDMKEELIIDMPFKPSHYHSQILPPPDSSSSYEEEDESENETEKMVVDPPPNRDVNSEFHLDFNMFLDRTPIDEYYHVLHVDDIRMPDVELLNLCIDQLRATPHIIYYMHFENEINNMWPVKLGFRGDLTLVQILTEDDPYRDVIIAHRNGKYIHDDWQYFPVITGKWDLHILQKNEKLEEMGEHRAIQCDNIHELMIVWLVCFFSGENLLQVCN